MRVGSIVYATDQGLGILAKSFFDNGIINQVVVQKHSSRPEHSEWYPDAPRLARVTPQDPVIRQLVHDCDALLFFETPFSWDIVDYARFHRVKTILMPMYECMPRTLPATPDLFICPSELDYDYYPDDLRKGYNSVHIPVPVSVPWRKRDKAEVFVHNAGHGGLRGRNGTRELIQALDLVKSDARFIIRSQEPIVGMDLCGTISDRITNVVGTVPYDQLWSDGDVFVFPEKFNGLSLPLQEAFASGMGVMCTDRYPMTRWLPNEIMIPRAGYRESCVSGRCNLFQEAVIRPEDIAATIDSWYGADISKLSEAGKKYAEANSWEVLKPLYLKAIES